MAYREDTKQFFFYPQKGLDYDECQIDKSGRWLVIKEKTGADSKSEVDNRIIDLQTGNERVLLDRNGAGGHSDMGAGYMVASDNLNPQPGAVRVWRFDMDVTRRPATGVGRGPGDARLPNHVVGHRHRPRLARELAHQRRRRSAVRLRRQRQPQGSAARERDRLLPPRRIAEHADRGAEHHRSQRVRRRVGRLLEDAEGQPRRHRRVLHLGGQLRHEPPRRLHRADSEGQARWQLHAADDAAHDAANHTDAATADAADTRRQLRPRRPPTTPPTTPGGSGTAVVWTNLVNVTATGNSLRKTAGCGGCPDAGAYSQQQVSGSGFVQFTMSESDTLRFIGLTSGGTGTNAGDIRYALRLQSGRAEVRESGAYRSEIAVASGDTLRIAIGGGSVQYSKNGAVFFTSAGSASSLFVKTSLYDLGATISNVTISSGTSTTSSAGAAAATTSARAGYARDDRRSDARIGRRDDQCGDAKRGDEGIGTGMGVATRSHVAFWRRVANWTKPTIVAQLNRQTV